MIGYESTENALLAEIDGLEQDGLVFCSKAYALFEAVRAGPDGIARLRKLQGRLIDRLTGELLPLCRYIQQHYQAGRYMSVKWFNGGQPFDAIVTQRGAVVDAHGMPAQFHVEVTSAQHPNEYLVGHALEEHGVVFGVGGMQPIREKGKLSSVETTVKGYMGDSHVVEFDGFLNDAIAKKTQKKTPYPDQSTLVVVCRLTSSFYPDEWEALLERVRPKIKFGPFREIYVYDARTHMDRLFTPSWIGHEAV
jgi:hypothetical protein